MRNINVNDFAQTLTHTHDMKLNLLQKQCKEVFGLIILVVKGLLGIEFAFEFNHRRSERSICCCVIEL